MNIILDTCIIFNNFYFDSRAFKTLQEYLNKTRSIIYIPSIVRLEVLKKYDEELRKFCNSVNRNRIFAPGSFVEYNFDNLSKEYVKYFDNYCRINNIKIIETNDYSSNILLEREIKIKPPYKENGSGLRDTLIWFTVLDIIKSNPLQHFCFLSTNSADFGLELLKDELVEEVKNTNSELKYFNTIEKFLELYGEKISSINYLTIKEYFDLNSEDIISQFDHDKIYPVDFGHNVEFVEIDEVAFDYIEIDDFYIYKADKNNYYVHVDASVGVVLTSIVADVRDGEVNDLDHAFTCQSFPVEISLLISKESLEIKLDPDQSMSIYY